jgi:hypothetical protein
LSKQQYGESLREVHCKEMELCQRLRRMESEIAYFHSLQLADDWVRAARLAGDASDKVYLVSYFIL